MRDSLGQYQHFYLFHITKGTENQTTSHNWSQDMMTFNGHFGAKLWESSQGFVDSICDL